MLPKDLALATNPSPLLPPMEIGTSHDVVRKRARSEPSSPPSREHKKTLPFLHFRQGRDASTIAKPTTFTEPSPDTPTSKVDGAPLDDILQAAVTALFENVETSVPSKLLEDIIAAISKVVQMKFGLIPQGIRKDIVIKIKQMGRPMYTACGRDKEFLSMIGVWIEGRSKKWSSQEEEIILTVLEASISVALTPKSSR
jgi:hypothetical protein